MRRFVRADAGPGVSIIYTDDQGKRFISVKGDKNFRLNNPGNLVPGAVSKRNGQIGVVRGFAVFPDVETGRKAMIDSLKTVYGNKSLSQMIRAYAPEHENDTAAYLRHLRRRTGVKDEKKINDLSPAEFDLLVKAIIDMEGKEKLVLREIRAEKKSILRVRKDRRGSITHYFVADLGWLNKEEAVDWTRKGEVDAVIAISKGKPYLRTHPDITVVNNLDNKE